ncbi:response regulator transcription factor [Ottowia sp.]|uniref:response regulator transcription factor n=1 Tax=Ottowia sp. TaxID=1898956 RepID=UPI00260C2DBE|nr:response regulator transcription factor [Ottowia sp.]
MSQVLTFHPEGSATLTILIADDHPLVRDGLRTVIAGVWPSARLVEAANADQLLALATQLRAPALALVDLNMPGMDQGARLGSLARACPALPLVVVSALTVPDVVRRALSLPSVHAFVSKSADGTQLTEAIKAALTGRKLPYAPPAPAEAVHDVPLTPRMREIRMLLRQGLSNKHIAQQLGLSEGTVKNYLSEIFRLLKVSNRTQAAQYDSEIT